MYNSFVASSQDLGLPRVVKTVRQRESVRLIIALRSANCKKERAIPKFRARRISATAKYIRKSTFTLRRTSQMEEPIAMDPPEYWFFQNSTINEATELGSSLNFYSIARSVSIVFGILSNVTILLVLGVKLRLRRFSHSVMLSLACADVTFLLVNATLNYREYFDDVPRGFCVAIALLTDLRLFVYCGTLLLVAVQHYCTIVRARRITPLCYNVHLSFAIIWLVSMAICVGLNAPELTNSGQLQSADMCGVSYSVEMVLKVVVLPLTIVVTLIGLPLVYFRPLMLLRDQSPSLNSHEKNTLLTDLVVTAAFFAFCCGTLLTLALDSLDELNIDVHNVLLIVTSGLSTMANCVIYVALSQEFRKALRSLRTC